MPQPESTPERSPEHEQPIKTFIRHLPVAVAMLDRDLCYVEASDQWCLDYGLDAGKLKGRSHYEIFPEISPLWKQLHQRGLAGEILKSEEDFIERPGGRGIWLRWEIRPWGDSGGRPDGILIFCEDITRRKLAEEALQKQLDYLQKILAAVPGAVHTFRMHPDGSESMPYVSPGFGRMFPEAMDSGPNLGEYLAMMHPGDVDRLRAGIFESARTMTPWRESYRMLTPNRGEKWVECHSIPTREPDGSICWHGYLSDITDQKRMERALEDAKQEYRDLVDNGPDSVARLDTECRYLFVNGYTLKVTGLREEDFIGKRVDEIGFLAAVAREVMQSIRRVAAMGQLEELEVSMPLAGAETSWHIRFVPEFDNCKSVRSVLAISSDITARRRAEEAARRHARESNERQAIISAIFDRCSQAILGVDTDGTVQFANRMAGEMFGYEPGELFGRKVEILVPERFREKHAGHRNAFECAPEQRLTALELTGTRKNGSEFPIEVSFTHLNTGKGFLAVAFAADITVRKENEAALRESAAELRKLSLALIAADEESARQIARELHDDITQKLAFLSMEIGKTAAARLSSAALVRELRSFQARILEISEDVRQISHQMHPSILDDLGLGAALESMCQDLERIDGIPVRFVSRDVPETVDPSVASCVYRVAQESLRNISKHAKANEVSVLLSLEYGVLALTITDSGIGFDSATRKAGLGTQSMKERVRLVRGELSVSSTPGRGTSVAVRIPFNGEIHKPEGLSAGK